MVLAVLAYTQVSFELLADIERVPQFIQRSIANLIIGISLPLQAPPTNLNLNLNLGVYMYNCLLEPVVPWFKIGAGQLGWPGVRHDVHLPLVVTSSSFNPACLQVHTYQAWAYVTPCT